MSGKGSFWAAKRQTDTNTATLTTVSSSLTTVSSSLDSNVSSPLTVLTSSYATGSAVTNTTDETTLVSYTIPANTFNTGSVVNIRSKIYISNVTASAALTVRARFSGSNGDVFAFLGNSGPISGDSNYLDIVLMGTETPGSGSFVSAGGFALAGGAVTSPCFAPNLFYPTDQTLDLVLTGQWDAANASSAHMEHFIITKLETQI